MAKHEAAKGPGARIRWSKEVADHDYAAGEAFLSLVYDPTTTAKIVARLREVPLTTRRANDILRACGADAAALDDPGVMKDLIKVIEGKRLSPVLVVATEEQARIADGYHRVSLVYRLDAYGEVPLKIARA